MLVERERGSKVGGRLVGHRGNEKKKSIRNSPCRARWGLRYRSKSPRWRLLLQLWFSCFWI